MSRVTFDGGTVEVEAALIASGLGLDEAALRAALRDGSVTTVCERGQGDDEGRFRLTFFSASRRLRIVVDAAGKVLRTTSVPFARRKPGSEG